MPLHRRLPKRGFTNIHRIEYECVNLSDILNNKKLDLKEVINPEVLVKAGLIRKARPLKILGDGDLNQPLKIEATKFTASAEKKITEAGGSAVTIQKK